MAAAMILTTQELTKVLPVATSRLAHPDSVRRLLVCSHAYYASLMLTTRAPTWST